jgi:cell division protein FtsQ
VKKEGKSWRRSAIQVVVVGGVLITAAIVVLYTPWFHLLDLREVSVGGNRHVTAAELVGLSGLHGGQSLLALSPRRIADRLLTHYWIKEVTVQRDFPHAVRLQIVEREEIAWIASPSGEGCLVLGEGGVVVTRECPPSGALLEVRGAQLTGDAPGSALADPRVATLIGTLWRGDLQIPHIVRLDVSDSDSIEMSDEDGLRLRLGSIEGIAERVRALAALCRAIDVRDYELIDLRVGGEATLVPRKAVRR